MEQTDRIRDALSRAALRTQQRASGPPRTSREDLVSWARTHLRGHQLVVVSNREPYSHVHLDGGVRKRVLRHAIRPLVPAEILTRPKEGFSMPMKHWLRGELQPMMRDLLTSSSASEWFDTGECTRLMDEHVSGRFNHAHLLWTLVVLQRWRERSANSGALAEGAA